MARPKITDLDPSLKDTIEGKAEKSSIDTKISSVSEDLTPELGGELDSGENTIGFTEKTNTSTTGAVTIDWTTSNKQTITLTEDTTFAFTDPTNPCNLVLHIKQDSTGGWTPTFPTLLTSGGSGISLTTTANADDILMLYYDGANYYASLLADMQ